MELMRRIAIRLFPLLCLLLCSTFPASSQPLHSAEVDRFAKELMSELDGPPGMAIVIVKDGKVLMHREYGLADVANATPVSGHTRFYIASSTKSFTAAAAKLLAAQGKLDLDAPLTKAFPALVLTPPLTADRISLRDLLTHRAAITSGAVNFRTGVFGNMSDAEIIENFGKYTDSAPIGFRYNNVGYILTGLAIGHASGTTWQEALRQLVFAPLGMNETTAKVADLAGKPVAIPYRELGAGRFVPARGKVEATMHPAGGVFTTATDLGRWLLAQLGDGRIGTEQLLPREAVRELHAPQVNLKATWGPVRRYAYGLGWYLGDYDGDLLVHHYGGFTGSFAHISFMPDRGVGVAVLSNGGSESAELLAYWAYDRLLAKKSEPGKYETQIATAKAKLATDRTATAAAIAKMNPAAVVTSGHALAVYAGRYHSDRMGDIEVQVHGNRLEAIAGVISTPLVATGDDAFLVDWLEEGSVADIHFVFEGETAQKLDWGGRVFDRK
jgi:CubicO group peptidase (beta-lactamase class C family)